MFGIELKCFGYRKYMHYNMSNQILSPLWTPVACNKQLSETYNYTKQRCLYWHWHSNDVKNTMEIPSLSSIYFQKTINEHHKAKLSDKIETITNSKHQHIYVWHGMVSSLFKKMNYTIKIPNRDPVESTRCKLRQVHIKPNWSHRKEQYLERPKTITPKETFRQKIREENNCIGMRMATTKYDHAIVRIPKSNQGASFSPSILEFTWCKRGSVPAGPVEIRSDSGSRGIRRPITDRSIPDLHQAKPRVWRRKQGNAAVEAAKWEWGQGDIQMLNKRCSSV